jgi:two-component system, OmpR family, phosphate regulon response regulator PhoB
MSQILVVEDEPAIAELIAINVRHAGHSVALAANAQDAQAAVAQALPDLVLLDWMLPGRSGLDLARTWRLDERTRHLPIIMLTARAAEDDKLVALDLGADDYITKPFSTRELLARVRAVLRRKAPETLQDAVTLRDLKLDPTTRRVQCQGQDVAMGPTEFKLLHYFMTHAERVHTRAQLLDRVWGDHVFIEERTIDVHVKRLREALTTVGRASMLETVRGVGYRFTQQPPPAAA